MKIYEAINFVPPKARKSKFSAVWKALALVPVGAYLPIQCDTKGEATHLSQEVKARGLKSERRDKMVFIEGIDTVTSVQINQSIALGFDAKPFGFDIHKIRPNVDACRGLLGRTDEHSGLSGGTPGVLQGV